MDNGHETMCHQVIAIKYFMNFKQGWKAAVVNSVGLSGGMIAIRDPYRLSFKSYIF